ncbi:hypothetical protein ANCDUO_21574, partial [Ancylostoma duodenale]
FGDMSPLMRFYRLLVGNGLLFPEVSTYTGGMGRGELEEICDRYLSRREEQQKVTEAVERCLRKGYDYDKMKDRVLEAITDSHRAHKVISAICIAYPQFRKRTK